ncbi:MAG: zinc dependent phospholipase C family protein [Peptococcaceae bacterium]|nr:zinc dependent phospholipase C family protein [Peptococcaceae bacterium]
MPDVWTHIFCGREVLAGVGENFKELAREKISLFLLGCQGPDIFFYYNFLPWNGDKRVFLLGERIHREKCGLFLRESLKYLKRNPDAGTTKYLMALICHWCLDRITHPLWTRRQSTRE